MAPGRRASMRSVRTLPIVHEDDDMIVATTPELAAAYPVRQKRHSGVVTQLPPLPAGEVGEATESGSGSASDDDTPSPPSPSRTPQRNPNPRRYSGGSIHSHRSQGSQGSLGSRQSYHSQPQHIGPIPSSGYGLNYPYVNPACSESSEESGITDRKLEEQAGAAGVGAGGRGLPKRSQNREWFSKRGGWWRLILTLLLLAVIAVGLGVGLKFGLQQANNNSSSSSNGDNNGNGSGSGGDVPSTPATPSDQFPAGSYSFTVALTNVSTACTTNGFAFGCAPGANNVFSSSASPTAQNASAVTFEWIIEGTTSGSTSSASTLTTYTISSHSSSPFPFSNIHMTLLDSGLSSERLVFNLSMDLAYIPTNDLVDHQTSAATCYFNQTTTQATLWTKQRATFPSSITAIQAPVNASSTFSAWPFAVELSEVQQAGPAIPDCVDYHGNSLGDFSIPDGGGDAADVCGCWYSNMVSGSSGSSGSKNGTSMR
ncbi:hypothetical protein Sste5346_004110 [Sporothrix stenoceras]|uniref:Tat pathway signal sequence n=1 Tax=Sporothrix stenoceras TaxID=5173 RepID=A0ABR3ZAM0_9PEZI